MANLHLLNQPKMFAREFSGFFMTIAVNKCKLDKCKLLLHFHHFPKDNFLTSDYVRPYFYPQMDFLGSEFSTWLYKSPTNVMELSRTHRQGWKYFGRIYSTVKISY